MDVEHDGCVGCAYIDCEYDEHPCCKCKNNYLDMYSKEKPKVALAEAIKKMSVKELVDWIYEHDTITQARGRLTRGELLDKLMQEEE